MYNRFTIYKITNKINGKVNIGQTTRRPELRWSEHLKDSQKEGLNYPLYNSMRKYGVENFTFESICSCFDIDELNYRETYFIAEYQSDNPEFGYNCDKGGGNKLRNQETRKRQSNSQTGRKNHQFGKKGSLNPKFGRRGNLSPIFGRVGVLCPNYGKKRPKIAEARKNFTGEKHPHFDETVYHWIHENGTEEFCTQYALRKKYSLDVGNLSRIIRKPHKTCKGWRIICIDK